MGGGRRGEAEARGGEGGSGQRHDELISQGHMVECAPIEKLVRRSKNSIRLCKINDEQFHPFPSPDI
jgi:hypothetical protein